MSEQEAEAVFSGDEETHGEADESNKLLDSESTTIQLLKSSAGASVTIREPSNGDSSYQVSPQWLSSRMGGGWWGEGVNVSPGQPSGIITIPLVVWHSVAMIGAYTRNK